MFTGSKDSARGLTVAATVVAALYAWHGLRRAWRGVEERGEAGERLRRSAHRFAATQRVARVVRNHHEVALDEAGGAVRASGVVQDVTGRREVEGALHASEARLRAVIDQAPLGVHVFAPDGTSLLTNAAWHEMWNLREGEEPEGSNVFEDEQIRSAGLLPYIGAAVERGGTVTSPSLPYDPARAGRAGRARWFRATVYPVKDGGGRLVEAALLLEDTTKGREALEALEESGWRFRTVVESLGEGLLITDPSNAVLYANPRMVELCGYAAGEMLGRPAHELLLPPELWGEAIREHRERLKGTSRRRELRLRRKDGEAFWAEVSSTPYRNSAGRVVGVVRAFADATERRDAEAALRRSEERYRALVEQIPAITYLLDLAVPGRLAYVSPQVEAVLGYSPQEARACESWAETLHPDDRGRVLAEHARSAAAGAPFELEYRQIAKDGRVVWLRDQAVPVRDELGRPRFVQGVKFDITERRRIEQRLEEAEERYRTLVERVPPIIYVQEPVAAKTAVYRTTYISPRVEEVLGYPPRRFEEDPQFWDGLIHPDDLRGVLAEDARTDETGEPFCMEYRMRARDGRTVWVRDEAALVRDGEGRPLYWQGAMSDVTERKASEEKLEHRALHDPLTGLPNRASFEDRLRHALRRARRRGDAIAVLFVDLDNFKVINDSLGHKTGDRLLVSVSKRLRAVRRPEDTVARLGGDEFVFLLEHAGANEASAVAGRVLEKLQAPFSLGGKRLYVTASVGVAVGGDDGKDVARLMRDADLAMYRAKRAGKAAYAVFEEGMDALAVERLELEHELRRALDRGEFTLRYQPKVSLENGRMVGFEALLRWRHPERGLIPPAAFVPVAEEAGLMVSIGRWCLEEACRQVLKWQMLFPDDPQVAVSVNLSPAKFRHPDLAEHVGALLREYGLDPRGFTLEITEDAAMEDAAETLGTLRKLKELGVRIEVDDFGTGFSSLFYLKRFPVDSLKVDRSFVAGLGRDPEDEGIAGAVVQLAHTLGLEAVAEGVETERQLGRLREMGCDLAQGFYFSEPLSPEAAEELLEAGGRL